MPNHIRQERGRKKPLVIPSMVSGVWESVQDSSDSTSRSEDLATESEVLQKITDYSTEELSHKVCTLQFL